MKANYYPDKNDDRADWWQNIADNAEPILSVLGFSDGDAEAVIADAKWAVYCYSTLRIAIEGSTKTLFGWADTVTDAPSGTPRPALPALPTLPAVPTEVITCGIEDRRSQWVARAKAAPNYDPAVQGATLRTEPTGVPFNPNTYVAEISAATSPESGTVRIKFGKARGNISGMAFTGRKTTSTTTVPLGRFTATPATLEIPISTPGQPEEWQITGRALKKDVEIGIESAALTVLVKG